MCHNFQQLLYIGEDLIAVDFGKNMMSTFNSGEGRLNVQFKNSVKSGGSRPVKGELSASAPDLFLLDD